MVLGELGDVLMVDHHQAGQVGAAVADHHGIGDVGGELELVLDFTRRDVLAAGGDDDVLHPIDDVDVAVVVDAPHVASVQPALAEGFRGLLRLVPIARYHAGAADEDLALVRKGDVNLRVGLAHAADAGLAGQVGGGKARALGLPIDLEHGFVHGPKPVDQLRRDGRGAG